jgi:glucose-1-phosphate cytidylyltransferase
MDTLRDRQVLEDMVERGDTPWRIQQVLPTIKAA